jgi:hypothetical protein
VEPSTGIFSGNDFHALIIEKFYSKLIHFFLTNYLLKNHNIMKTEKELVDQVTNYNKEIDELTDLQDHCATMKWWSIVAEIKKVIGLRKRDIRQVEGILGS